MRVDFSTLYANAKAQAEQRAADRRESTRNYLDALRNRVSSTDKYNLMRTHSNPETDEITVEEAENILRNVALKDLLHGMTGEGSNTDQAEG